MFGSLNKKKKEFTQDDQKIITNPSKQYKIYSSSNQNKMNQSANKLQSNLNDSQLIKQELKKSQVEEMNNKNPTQKIKLQQQQQNIVEEYQLHINNQYANPPPQVPRKYELPNKIILNKQNFGRAISQYNPQQKDQNIEEHFNKLNSINPKIIVKAINGRQILPSSQKKQKQEYQPDQQKILQLTQTIFKTQKSTCSHCNQQIESNFIQLNCLHFYHIECLEEFIQIQVYQVKFNVVQCHCGKSIGQKFIMQVCDKLLPIIFSKQMEIIKQKYDKQLLICNFCSFFCIYNLEKTMDSFCPNCLIRISKRQQAFHKQ